MNTIFLQLIVLVVESGSDELKQFVMGV
jgi:hypothetical protein